MFCKNCGQQIKLGTNFCKNCGQEVKLGRFAISTQRFFQWIKDHLKVILVVFGIVILLIVIGSYNEYSTSPSSNEYSKPVSSAPQEPSYNQTNLYNQKSVAASVVNIFCPSTQSDEEVSGGSGTIINEDGLILTNSHIIPQNESYLHVDEEGCLVVLPDPITGQPSGFYLAHPIVLPTISDNYDLAYMSIYAAYYDTEKREYAGTYPRKFPAFDTATICSARLGDPIRIFGYPAISGGYSLTITDGVISSFPADGIIITSAKVSHGNSGGLAVDRNGCMIGVPSMVNSDDAESLGVIISMDLVRQFDDEVTTYINNLE